MPQKVKERMSELKTDTRFVGLDLGYETKRIGWATLVMGDCLEVMRSLPDASVDMVLCDLPYGTTACKWDAVIPFDKLWPEYRRVTKRNAAIVLTASQPFTSALLMSNPQEIRHEWIWRKNAGSNFAVTKWQPMKEHESVLVFGKETPRYFPIKQPRTRPIKVGYTNTSNTGKRDAYNGMVNKGFTVTDGEMRVPSSVQNFNRERGHHPTQKPVKLLEQLISIFTDEGDVVIDPCAGSGSTLIAAHNLGRRGYGFEIKKEFFAAANEWIESNAMQGSIFAPTRRGKSFKQTSLLEDAA